MALQTSGAISLANLQGQYGGANPISMSEYHRKTDNSGYVDHSKTVTTGEYYATSGATYHWRTYLSTSHFLYWNGVNVGNPSGSVTSYTTGGYTYLRGTYVTVAFNNYYYKIKRRYTTYLNQNVPTSGAISLSQFYGGTN